MRHILRFLRQDDGPTAVEYAVMLSLIMMACIAAVQLVGSSTMNSLSNTNTSINNAISGS
jgi:pilus assembly protein Flp/PilA